MIAASLRTAASICAAGVLALSPVEGVALAQTPASAPQFDGVWQPLDPPLAFTTLEGDPPPLREEFRAGYEQTKAMAARGERAFDPSSTMCLAPGAPRILSEDMPFEIVVTSDQVFFGYQWNRLFRYVDLDRPLEVLSPFYFGNSVGEIAGDTLTIEAGGFNERTFIDRSGLPHSDQLSLSETYRLSDDGSRMTVTIRIEDPVTFERPWETQLQFVRVPGGRIVEDICTLRQGLVPERLQFFDPE